MSATDVTQACGLEVFPHERVVFVNGRPVELTPREFDILVRLASHPGWVYSAEQLADGEEQAADHSPDSVRVHVAHLRRKFAHADAADVVDTVRGAGYRLHNGNVAVIDGGLAEDGARDRPDGDPIAVGDAEESSRQLRDSFWLLERAVMALESNADPRQVRTACAVLDGARHVISGLLSKAPPW